MTDEIDVLAAYLDAEGYFGCYHSRHGDAVSHIPQIGVTTTDADTAVWIAGKLDARSLRGHDYHDGRKLQYRVRLSGRPAVTLMHQLLPRMISSRRKEQIMKALTCYGDGKPERA